MPAQPRDSARMMVVRRDSQEIVHAHVRDLPRWLQAGDQLVLNETKVSKAEFYKEFKLPDSIPTSTGLAAIKETLPDFEVSIVQDWFDARK